jgi:5-oxoprolinase (ATP-hydrolysing)
MHIADEMGVVLQRTARSVNIKERLDFSCALFSPAGELIANAPHIPVHLGSMDDSVKALLQKHRNGLCAGNIYLCNAPYNGGTHLPDLTVISPVIDAAGELVFVAASRAHHADIGGISPGSMPPNSKHIDEEGVIFNNFLLVEDGHFRTTELYRELTAAHWPARNPEQNIADCKAQIAANERGRSLLLQMLQHYSPATVLAYVGHTLDNAEESIRRVITELGMTGDGAAAGPRTFTYPFDNGQKICVAIHIDPDKREAHIDFSGTSEAGDNNLNAPASVCQAAVMYVFRTLVAANIPLNAGCRRPLRLSIPEGCMLNPVYPAAVVGGNVETSQCITDTLYGALGVLAASQGTMNNLSFGNEQFQYYETICGGAGAGDGFNGADAVQTHMTNSRMTDAEILELRYPVLVREFAVRPGSGGVGRYSGGNGVIRRLEFRKTMSAAILSNHRRVAPFGIAGGQNALTGSNRLERRDGKIEELGGIAEVEMQEGDVLVIETPGGGGYGAPSAKQ